MVTTADKLKGLKEREEKELAMGGAEQIQKQHDRGKLTARERLDLLFDPIDVLTLICLRQLSLEKV
jgi:acetyl-CoA carboxylase carboxyltransferase component